MRDDGPKQFGRLREGRAHQEPAVRAALDREALGLRDLQLDEPARAGEEVVEHVLLAGEPSRVVPLLAELAAAAQDRGHLDDAVLREDVREIVICGHGRDSEAAVARQEDRIPAVPLRALWLEDEHRDARPVLRERALLDDLGVREVRDRLAAHHGRRRDLLRRIPDKSRVRLQEGRDAVEHVIAVQRLELARGGDRRGRQLLDEVAVEVVRPDAALSAQRFDREEARPCWRDRLDHARALIHDQMRGGERRVRRRQPEDASAGSALLRDHPDRPVRAEARVDDAIRERADALPLRGAFGEDVKSKVAAVAVLDEGEPPPPVHARAQKDLGDAGQVLAERVPVLSNRRAEIVEPDLLEEVEIFLWPLALTGIARVEETLAVGRPGGAPARRALLHERDHIAGFLPRLDIENVKRALLASALGERDGDPAAVGRRHEPVEGRVAARVEGVRVDDRPHAIRARQRRQEDDPRLLLARRIEAHRERLSATDDQSRDGGRPGLDQMLDPRAERRPAGELVEERAGAGVLGFGPGFHLRPVAVFEPAVVVDDFDAVIAVRHGHPGGHGLCRDRGGSNGREERCGDGEGRERLSAGHQRYLVLPNASRAARSSRSNASSASRPTRSRPIVTTASVRSPSRYASVASLAVRLPWTSIRSHLSA